MSISVTDKQVKFFAGKLAQLADFANKPEEARTYARTVLETMRQKFGKGESFTDQLLCLSANIMNLDGEITALAILPEDLAVMTETEILSRQQKREQEALVRKRAREKTTYDKTSMLCGKCGLVRRDRININEIGLDSEENGTQFDYNFDNTCSCSHSSEEDTDNEDTSEPGEGDSPTAERARKKPREEADGTVSA